VREREPARLVPFPLSRDSEPLFHGPILPREDRGFTEARNEIIDVIEHGLAPLAQPVELLLVENGS
jgi:hypothetical protein